MVHHGIVYWIWWDSWEDLKNLLKSIPFWFFEVTVAASLGSYIGSLCGPILGMLAVWSALFLLILLCWAGFFMCNLIRLCGYIYARDAAALIVKEKKHTGSYSFNLNLETACYELREWAKRSGLKSIGRAPRRVRCFVSIPKEHWKTMRLDYHNFQNVNGARGATIQDMDTQWHQYTDVMFRRRVFVRQLTSMQANRR